MTDKRNDPDDLSEMFDLDRKKAIATLVGNMEQCLRDVQDAQEDLKQLSASAKEAGFTVKDVSAMKRVAKLRLDDDVVQARKDLERLQRIADAAGVDLFSWAKAS